MSLTPENSNTGWPSFGERFKSTRDSTHRWMKEGAQVTGPLALAQRASMRRLLTGLGSVALARCDSGFEDNSQ